MNQELTTKNDLRTLIGGDKMREQFAAALPAHLSPERFARISITAISRTPKLAECTRESLMRCLLDLSAMGIEPDGRRAHLIPFENRKNGTVECTLIVDWKGYAELAMRSGIIAKLHADVVCTNDKFKFNLGEITAHVVDYSQPRGEVYAAYAMAVTTTGQTFVQVLTREEIDGIRKRSRSGNNGPWVTDFSEMAKKTAFRRLAKWLPLSAEFRDAVDKDDDKLTERDVTPIVARSEPLDPFAGIPAIVDPPTRQSEPERAELAFELEPTDNEPRDEPLIDLLAVVADADADRLTACVKEVEFLDTEASKLIAKKAITERAAVLGVKWSKAKGGFAV